MLGGQRVHRRLRLPDGDAGREPGNRTQSVELVVFPRRGTPERKLVLPVVEPRRHDADNGGGRVVEPQGLADYPGAPSEASLPRAVAQDDDLLCPWLVVLEDEAATEQRLDTERREQRRRNLEPSELFGWIPLAAHNRPSPVVLEPDGFKHVCALLY